ncbi:lytic transglycosylase domain-containing protein [Thermodesulfobacteriota bacterium]
MAFGLIASTKKNWLMAFFTALAVMIAAASGLQSESAACRSSFVSALDAGVSTERALRDLAGDIEAGREREIILSVVKSFRTGLPEAEEEALVTIVQQESLFYGYDPILILSIIKVESTFYNWSKSPAGAMGLMQIRPFVGKAMAREADIEWEGPQTLYDPVSNVRIGTYYLSKLLLQFQDLRTALAAYNRGPTAVRSLMREGERVPLFYASRIITTYGDLKKEHCGIEWVEAGLSDHRPADSAQSLYNRVSI